MNISKDKLYLVTKDYSVSQEIFELYQDETLDMLVTSPQPTAENLGKYYQNNNYISHTDSKKTLFEKAYYLVKKRALKNKLALINKHQSRKGNLLDIGAGTGDFLVTAQNNGWQTTGIEPSEKAKNLGRQKGILFADDSTSLPDASFDVITMWHVLEHVPDLEAQINELKRLLKPSGTLIVAVPNFKSYDALYYKTFWAAYDAPIHFWHFSKTAIQNIFESKGFTLQQVLPMWFDAFYVSLLSEQYKTGRMNFVKAVFIGLLSNIKAIKSREFSSQVYILCAN